MAAWPRPEEKPCTSTMYPRWSLQRGGQIVQRRLGIVAQHALSGTEARSGLVGRFVLVDIADDLLDAGQTGVGLGRGLLRCLGLVAGVDSMLVGVVRFVGRQLMPCWARESTSLIILLFAAVSSSSSFKRSRIGLSLPLHIFLAGKRIQMSPEAFARGRLQRFPRRAFVRARLRSLIARGRRLALGGTRGILHRLRGAILVLRR